MNLTKIDVVRGRMRPHWCWIALAALVVLAPAAIAQGVTTTTVQGTVYLANGQPGAGTLVVSWPAFTTSAAQAIAADSTTLTIPADGLVSVNLAPNQGATPAGEYYTAVYYMSDGSTSTEYWVVPAAAQATLAQVQAQLMPAVQAVSKAYVDQSVAEATQSELTASGGNMTGPLFLSADPTQPLQAADKHYVDDQVATAGGNILTSGSAGQYAKLSSSSAMQGVSPAAVLSDLTGCTSSSSGSVSCPGGVQSSTVNSSVNTLINVMAPPYNAKGDCSTDDNAAITAALRAADTYAVGLSGPAIVYFPKPPGGCYLTSTLTWYGESLEGQAPGGGSAFGNGGLVIQGKTGEDILHVPDPTSNNYTFYGNWSIQNISFVVDSSAAGSFPHRWPGRWNDDGAITAGSAVFTGPHALISCGDVGQAIQVNGAGAGGANLVTTIASVFPCWSAAGTTPSAWTTITLAATASTTVSNAHYYVSVGDLPVTTNIGACALAFDDVDGNTADWANTNHSLMNLYDTIRDVQIASVGAAVANNSCGVYTQGVWGPYGIDVRNFKILRQVFGIVEGTGELNSYDQSSGNDYQKWDHGVFNIDTYPWISYNGGLNTIEDWELLTSYGPQILESANTATDFVGGWFIRVGEFEGASGSTGFRVMGWDNTIQNTQLTEGTQKVILDTENLQCNNCGFGSGTVEVNGEQNHIQVNSSGAFSATFQDNGRGNTVVGGAGANYEALPLAQGYPVLPMKGTGLSGQWTDDFLQSGNGNTEWTNNNDLFFWPTDIIFNGYGSPVYQNTIVTDSASPSGHAMYFSGGGSLITFSQFASSGYNGVVGTQIPAAKSTFYFRARCSAAGSANFRIVDGRTYTELGSTTFSCTTSYATYSFTIDLSADTGAYFGFGTTGVGAPMWVAWTALVPWDAARNVNGPINATSLQISGSTVIPSTVTGSHGTSGTKAQLSDGTGISGNVAKFAADGSLTDSGVAAGNATNVNGAYVPASAAAVGTNSSNQIVAATLAGSGAGLVTGPISGTTSNNAVCENGTNGQIKDCGASLASPGAIAPTTVTASGIITGANDTTRTNTTTMSNSWTTTCLVLPTVPVSTTKSGHCIIYWQMSSTSYTATFALGMNNAPTDVWGGSGVTYAAAGTTSWLAFTQSSASTTAISTAATAGAANTTYKAEIDFTMQTGSSNSVAMTIYGETSSSSGTLTIEPGSACYWLP